jgi:hypothetical protein
MLRAEDVQVRGAEVVREAGHNARGLDAALTLVCAPQRAVRQLVRDHVG